MYKILLTKLICCGKLIYVVNEATKFGLVVQLVRTLACHARGRGFEPHPGRQLYSAALAGMAQSVEHILGKDEVTSSTLVSSSKGRVNSSLFNFKSPQKHRFGAFFFCPA